MNVAAAAGALKHAGNEDITHSKGGAADRAVARAAAFDAVGAASYVHEPVFAAVQRRKSRGADQFAFNQPR
jgi:hypothetical protein